MSYTYFRSDDCSGRLNRSTETGTPTDVVGRVGVVLDVAFHRVAAGLGVTAGRFLEKVVLGVDGVLRGVDVPLGDDVLGRPLGDVERQLVLLLLNSIVPATTRSNTGFLGSSTTRRSFPLYSSVSVGSPK